MKKLLKTHLRMKRYKSILLQICLFVTSLILFSCQGIDIKGEKGATKEIVLHLLQNSFVVALCLILTLLTFISIFHFVNNHRWNRLWKCIEQRLTLLFIFIWLAGFCVYCVGMYIGSPYDHDVQKLVSVAWMAVLHAFGMFLLESDISAIHDTFHDSLYFMTWFSIVHFAAACVSMIFVIKHFGYNIIAGIHLWLTARFSQKKDNLYVFWGINEASYYLAKSIMKDAPDSHRILFVKTADDEDVISDRTGVDRLLSFLSVKNKDLKKFKELKCYTTNAFSRLSRCDVSQDEREQGPVSILEAKMGLHSLIHLFDRTEKHVHILMLGEDEKSNIKAMSNLVIDKHLNSLIDRCRVTIHCHARYDSLNRVFENSEYTKHLEVRIIDSAHMAIETLKDKKENLCLPVDFVNVEQDATVSSPLRSVVIGMGQCGRDAVRFLYEYGAFVKYDKENSGNANQSEFQCDVFDREMEKLAPIMRSTACSANISEVIKNLNNFARHRVNLYNTDYKEQMFLDFMEKNIKDENCIIIAIKNDEEGITLAVQLLKLALKKGADIEKFRIFVRSYDMDLLNHMEEIANFYNESVVKALGLKKNKQPIYIFGKAQELYTWRNIIDESIRKESFRYYNSYEGFDEPEKELGTKWNLRRACKLGKEPPFSFCKLNEIRRMEKQDMENAWHRFTKIRLIEKALEKALGTEFDIEDFAVVICNQQRHEDNTYGICPSWQIIMNTLAQTEHLRWNASHEMMGYSYDRDVKKEERDRWMRHTCLTHWKNLNNSTRRFDYKVVETSLKMYLAEKRNKI